MEFTGARGRYLVGRPLSGTLNVAVGTALTNLENRSVGLHSHGITDPGHDHDLDAGPTDSGTATAADIASPATTGLLTGTLDAFTGITVNNAGAVAGTNAPYIQLTACSKA